jgi:hypothetical protein
LFSRIYNYISPLEDKRIEERKFETKYLPVLGIKYYLSP